MSAPASESTVNGPEPTEPRSNCYAWFLILLGAALRLRTYVACRSLRRDEAMLTLNLVRRSVAGLLRPLDDAQGAPIGFLLLEKLSISTLGHNEYALRLVPLLAGIVSLPLFWRFASRSLGGWGGLAALGFFATSGPLVYYASETKQYSLDVAVALVLLNLAIGTRWSPPVLALAGSVAVWFSHPALFVLGGIGLAALAFDRRTAALLGVVACWAVSFGVEDRFLLRQLRGNEDLIRFWTGAFMPFPPRSADDMRWFAENFLGLFQDPVGLSLAAPAAALFLIGVVALGRTDKRTLTLALTPIGLALLASGLRKYPFSTRLILFTVPSALIPLAAGLLALSKTSVRGGRILARLALFVVSLGPAVGGAKNLVRPLRSEELKTVMRVVADRRQAGDKNYLYFASEPAFRFYTEYADRPISLGPPPIVGVWGTAPDRSDYARDVAALRGRGRVWFFVSHAAGGVEAFYTSLFDGEGRRLDSVREFGASAYLYQLGQSAP